MNVLGVIPARYASTRFPGKPLAVIHGKSMIRRVYEQSLKTEKLNKVVVATDDSRIFNHVKSFDGDVVMTSTEHLNGTSRCHEVVEMMSHDYKENFDVVVNIQGDEPYINPEQIDSVVALFEKPEVEIGTLAKKIIEQNEIFNPNVVKVVFGVDGHALYFSRNAIPFLRGLPETEWIKKSDFFKHIGIYGYRNDVLKKLVHLKPGNLERAEKLEQLRWLENGIGIAVGLTEFESFAVDTPDDLLKLTNTA